MELASRIGAILAFYEPVLLHDEEQVDGVQASLGPALDGREIDAGQDIPMGLEEAFPGCLSFSVRCRIALDIKPGSCPNPISLKAQGKIPVAILGTSEFDVTSVNPETLRLEGVPPLRYSSSDVGTPSYSENAYSDCYQCSALGGDGYQDLMLHFDARAIAQGLNSPGKKESRVLVLTGKKLDGTPFIARDVVKIVP